MRPENGKVFTEETQEVHSPSSSLHGLVHPSVTGLPVSQYWKTTLDSAGALTTLSRSELTSLSTLNQLHQG